MSTAARLHADPCGGEGAPVDEGVIEVLEEDDGQAPDEQEVSRYLDMSEDELFREIGRALEPPDGRHGQEAIRGAPWRTRGQQWFEDHKQEIRTSICGNQAVKVSARKEDRISLVSNICDCLLATRGWPPVLSVAALVVRCGIKEICDGYTEAEGGPTQPATSAWNISLPAGRPEGRSDRTDVPPGR